MKEKIHQTRDERKKLRKNISEKPKSYLRQNYRCCITIKHANTCTPLQAVLSEMSKTPMIGYLSLAQLPIFCLCLNLTAWFSSHGFLLVTHLLDLTALMLCYPPIYKSWCDSLSKHTGSLGMSWKSMSYVI